MTRRRARRLLSWRSLNKVPVASGARAERIGWSWDHRVPRAEQFVQCAVYTVRVCVS